MKKSFFAIAAALCLVLCVSFAFAGEEVEPYDKYTAPTPAPASLHCFLEPSFSVGFSEVGAAHYQFDFTSGLLETKSLNLRTPPFPGFYIAGDLPYALTDRLKVTLGARWAPGYNDGSGQENFVTTPPSFAFGRDMASGNSDWVTADLLASYVLAKNCSFVKDFSIIAGFRYDYHHMGLSEPTNLNEINSGPNDTTGLTVQTWGPVAGFTATFPGYKCGIYGGDIKLGVLGSPVVWGNVDYHETFTYPPPPPTIALAANGNLDAAQTEFFCISAEATAVSWKMCSGLQATVSIFADYTKFYGQGTLTGQGIAPGYPTEISNVGFKMSPDVLAVGFKVALAF